MGKVVGAAMDLGLHDVTQGVIRRPVLVCAAAACITYGGRDVGIACVGCATVTIAIPAIGFTARVAIGENVGVTAVSRGGAVVVRGHLGSRQGVRRGPTSVTDVIGVAAVTLGTNDKPSA